MTSPEVGPTTPAPQVVVVAGSGRSGTSSIAGVLKLAGVRVPQPEVPGNRSNPRGFFEPVWVVELQTRLLRQAGAVLTDARPSAFERTHAVAETAEVRATVEDWLQDQLGTEPALVVKDPRNSFFLPLWRRAATDVGAEVSFLTMLRHPAEVVGSKDAYYKARGAGGTVRHAQTTRAASWLNVVLFSELVTRDARRTFVPYNDLLDDWRAVVARVGTELGLAGLATVTDEAAAEIDEFVDPGLRRIRTGWDEIDCPADIQDMAEEAWDQLCVLAARGGFDADAEARLDAVRARYAAAYDDAEALAQSTAESARREGARQGRRNAEKAHAKTQDRARRAAGTPAAPSVPAGAPSPADRARVVARRARSGAGRVVRGVRRRLDRG
ncbi:sulfotransferase family protein [Nocardioides sp. AX2bis]|uniref:sulfotransferase family protein n=1 Tax=Nocardioides sp. AX2bis TaxID=2653157 RepID=UPI0012EF1750|nr:sulfotransferase family protein [Nocardioides sp. AX2bis]VXB12966.1 conserved hypothetical protein [Nocardioides sp. AX2bis]